MDLSKAFDTVDKTILKNKLHQLGMTELTTSLIDSYMSHRKFCMNNDKTYYKYKLMEYHKVQFWDHYYSYYTHLT